MTDEKKKQYTLPKEDIYEMQVVSSKATEGKENAFGPGKHSKPGYNFMVELLGTKDPYNDDQPIRVPIWNVSRPKSKLVAEVDGSQIKTNTFKLLDKLGLEPTGKEDGDDVNYDAIPGMFLRGIPTIYEKKDGSKAAKIEIGKLMSLTNDEHVAYNVGRKSEVLK